MNPCPSRGRLEELLADQLGSGEEATLETHISGCPHCQQTLEELTADTPSAALLRQRSTAADPTPNLVTRALRRPGTVSERTEPDGGGARQLLGSTIKDGPSPRKGWDEPLNLPGFEIHEELGHGGMGVVYRATQVALKRVVALKLIRGGLGDQLVRFRAEAEAIARLQHPNIVQIFDVNLNAAVPFLVLEFVNGGSLAKTIRRQPQPPRLAAELVERLARAMQFAHDQGVLHRDLKPSNVLLHLPVVNQDAASQLLVAVPKIGDFGLAKIVDSQERLTLSNEVMGTPQYMAPEQVQGRPPTRAVDIWALGAILYELLAGRTPFEAESAFDILQSVVHDEPLPLTRLQRKLPTDLETICLKCLAKEPRQRYASAGELADDLRRFLNGEPIKARPIASWQRLIKWTRRRPVMAGLLGVTFLVTLVAFASLGVALVQARKAELSEAARRQQADEARDQEITLRQQAERLSARALLDVAISQCEKGAIDHGLHTFVRVVELAESLRDAELDYAARVNLACWRRHYTRPRARLGHRDWVWSVVFSPDGQRVATCSKDGTARIWDVTTGEPVTTPLAHTQPVWAIAFSPDGRRLLTGSGDTHGFARLWDTANGKLIGEPLEHDFSVQTVAFHPDGESFLTVSGTQAQLWQTENRQRLGQPLRSQEHITTAVYSPSGKTILTGSQDGTAKLWRSDTGEAVGEVLRHPGSVTSVAFSPNGKTILTGCVNGEARLWDANTGKPIGQPMQHSGPIQAVAFGRDGEIALTGSTAKGTTANPSSRGEARLWRAAPDDPLVGRPLGPSLEHPEPVWCVAFSPTSQTILTGAQDGHARLWSAASSQLLATLSRYGSFTVRQVAYSPDGRTIATATVGNYVNQEALGQLCDAPPEEGLVALRGLGNGLWATDLSRDGRLALTGHRQGRVGIWDVSNGRRVSTLEHPKQLLAWAVFSPDGETILTATTDPNRVNYWKRGLEFGQWQRQPSSLPHESWLRRVAISPDGKSVATATERGKIRLWDFASGRLRDTMEHEGPTSLSFTPDSGVLAAANQFGVVKMWDTATAKLLRTWTHPTACDGGDFNGDGSLFLTGCIDAAARLWVVSTGKLLGRPRSHSSIVSAIRFHPDDRSYFTGTEGREVQRWDIALGKPLGPVIRLQEPIRGLSAAPTSTMLIRSEGSPTAILYHTPLPLDGDTARIKLALHVITGVKTDDDGATTALSAAELKACREELARRGGDPFAPAIPTIPAGR
ncbi:MAG: protein kinase [Gemmataceae bacterium]